MNTRKKNSFFHSFSISTSRFYEERKAHSSWGWFGQKDSFLWSTTPKTRSYAEKSTSRWIWLCQKDRIVTIQQLTLVLGRRARKGAVPLFFLNHRPHPTANFITSVPRQRWVPNRGKQTAAPLSSERDRTRAEPLHRKSSQCTQISPQGHHVRAPCPNKRRKDCVCHRGGSRFYPHTILNALLVLAIW